MLWVLYNLDKSKLGVRIKYPHMGVRYFFLTTAVAQLVASLQPITRDLQAVSFLLACNFLTVSASQLQRRQHTPAVERQPFATRDRKGTVPTRRFTRTMRSTQQLLLNLPSDNVQGIIHSDRKC